MIILKRISNYWRCQIAGWGFVTLLYILVAYTYDRLTEYSIIRIGLFILANVAVTHFLRWSVKRRNWLMLPLEKAVPRFLLATIFASALAALIVVSLIGLFEDSSMTYPVMDGRFGFPARLLTDTFDHGIFITPWVLIYYFYHYVQKTRRRHLLRGQK